MSINKLIIISTMLFANALFAENLSCKGVFTHHAANSDKVIEKAFEVRNIKPTEREVEHYKNTIRNFHEKIESELVEAKKLEVITYSKSTGQVLRFLQVDANLDSVTFEKLKDQTLNLMDDIAKVAPKEWLPKELIFELENKSDNAYFAGDRIRIPYQLNIEKLVKHPNKSKVIMVHETGHSVFDMALAEKSNLFKAFSSVLSQQMKAQDLQVGMFNEYNFIAAQLNKLQSQEKIDMHDLMKIEYLKERLDNVVIKASAKMGLVLSSIEGEVNKYTNELNKYNVDLEKLSKISMMSHEFVADVMAVVSMRAKNGDYRGEAMKEALNFFDYVKNADTENAVRDFTQKVRAEGWTDMEAHVGFNPARYHVWKYYISNPIYRNDPQLLFRKIVDATAKELLDRLELNRKMGRDLFYSPEYLNERLIDYLDREFAE